MNFRKRFPALLTLAVLLTALPARSQDENPPAVAARIAWITGGVSLESQGSDYWTAAPLNYTMVGGDRIYTEPGSRAAIQGEGTDVRVWGGTDVTLTNLNEQYEQLGLAQGSVRVRVFNLAPEGAVEVDTPNGAVIIQMPGDYRVNVYPEQASLVEVFAGAAQISGPGMNQEVDQGEAVQLYGENPVEIGSVEMPPADGLDYWSAERDQHMLESASAGYMSPDIPGYDDLDDYGYWTPGTEYGPVWFPRNVPPGWQPYTSGYWAWVQPWGYTWVDAEPWGYAPFHYGRWVVWGGRWGWVPGPPQVRPVYAPAFVAFVGGGAGVAAWFPLGIAEPFVPWYHCSPQYVRRVNVTNVNITVIRNVTIVNNYNVFIRQVNTVRTVNEIQVSNVRYVNRERIVAMRTDAMRSGAQVQTAVVHLNPAQRQQMARATMSIARPPAAPPAHSMAGPRQNISRPSGRPVLITPHGRAAATPQANQARFTPRSLPSPRPATEIQPARRAIVPNTRPAPARRSAQPVQPEARRPVGATAPANRSAGQPPARVSEAPAQAQPGARPESRPQGQPATSRPESPERPQSRPAQPQPRAYPPARPESRPAAPQPENRPPERPQARPAQPQPEARPPARPESGPQVRPPEQRKPAPKNEKRKPEPKPQNPR